MPQGSALPDIQTWGEPKVKTEKPDVDIKSTTSLSTYGWDEEYVMNKLWIGGFSSMILFGVGDGMIAWCCIQRRIPIMCLYDKELHKKTIEVHLLEKIIEKMEAASPIDARWYRTAAQLGCREAEDDSDGAKVKAAAAKAAATVKMAAAKAVVAAKAKGKRPKEASPDAEESSEEEDSATPSKKPRTKEEE